MSSSRATVIPGARPGTSRVTYNRLVGTPSGGSTIEGCDGHGTINAHIVAGYDDLAGFPFADAAGYNAAFAMVGVLGIVLLAADGPIVLCAVDWIGVANDGHRIFREELARAMAAIPASSRYSR